MFATAAAATVLLLVVFRGTGEPVPAPPPGPRVVANVALGDAFGPSARPGFGAMWLSDSSRGAILRVDPRQIGGLLRALIGG